jgi:hypothetical protein
MPASPPAQEKNEISLTGQMKSISKFVASTSVAARAKLVKRVTNSGLKMSMSSGQP